MVGEQEKLSEEAKRKEGLSKLERAPVEEACPVVVPPRADVSRGVSLIALQGSAGNAAVARLVARSRLAGGGPSGEGNDEVDAGFRIFVPQRGLVPILARAPQDGAQHDPDAGAGGTTPGGEHETGPESEEAVNLDPITIPAQPPVEVEVLAQGPMLEGKTTAKYTSTDPVISPNPPKASKAPKGACPDCGSTTCIRAQGTVSSTFSSNPTPALPDLDSHGFTDCQRKNAEKFVKNTLNPHEQAHVKAFKTNFDGTWKKAFDLNVCDAADATVKIKKIYDDEFAARKKKADDASDALDANGANQFVWDMDEGCEEKKP